MSFDQTIEGYRVTFREEEDYLNCRLQYLQYRKDAGTPGVIFMQYIQNGMYTTSIIVEDINTLINDFVYGESTLAVGNDSFAVGNDSYNTNTFTAGTAISTVGDVHIDGNLIVTGEISSSNIIGIAGGDSTDNSTVSVSLGGLYSAYADQTPSAAPTFDEQYTANYQEASMMGGVFPLPEVDLSEPMAGISKERLIEEFSDEPIKNRWDILDLRGEDNADD
jgi:hypothetical protein